MINIYNQKGKTILTTEIRKKKHGGLCIKVLKKGRVTAEVNRFLNGLHETEDAIIFEKQVAHRYATEVGGYVKYQNG